MIRVLVRSRPLWQVFALCSAAGIISKAAATLAFAAVLGWTEMIPDDPLVLLGQGLAMGAGCTIAVRLRRKGCI